MKKFLFLICLAFSISAIYVPVTKAGSPNTSVELRNKKAKKTKKYIRGLKNKDLQRFCNAWYGTRYKYGGCSPSGVDCSCFVKTAYKTVYGKTISRSSHSQYKQSSSVKKWKRLKEGDLVFFKIGGMKVNHVGIYLGDGRFIHASTKRGVILSSFDEDYYRKHFYKGGKIK